MKAEVIITLITNEIAKLNDHSLEDYSGDTLSRVAVRLANYKAGLGRYVADAKRDVWVAEKNYQTARASGYKRLRETMSATDAKELKILEADKEYDAFIKAQEVESALSALSFNVHDLIDAIKSRLINLQMERQENGIS